MTFCLSAAVFATMFFELQSCMRLESNGMQKQKVTVFKMTPHVIYLYVK
jgi:hypothetical protein